MQKGRVLLKLPRAPHFNKLFEFSAVQKLRNTKTNYNYYIDQKGEKDTHFIKLKCQLTCIKYPFGTSMSAQTSWKTKDGLQRFPSFTLFPL